MACNCSFPEPKSAHARQDQCRSVYWIGQGPGVVLMHELPGLTDFVVTFGREIPASGYTVFMPVMFGKPFPGGLERLANETGICINREFSLFSQCKSSPITAWLRMLCGEVHGRCGGLGVGAIGLCLSGGFVLSMMVEKSVLAPVMSEPALPLPVLRNWQRDSQAALGMSPNIKE
jgi:dienelactone hydrolase